MLSKNITHEREEAPWNFRPFVLISNIARKKQHVARPNTGVSNAVEKQAPIVHFLAICLGYKSELNRKKASEKTRSLS